MKFSGDNTHVLSTILKSAQPLTLTKPAEDYAALLEHIGDAKLVLIGEASHGTHDFYRERIQITKLLIEQKGFATIVAEADWPDAYRLNRYVRGESGDPSADAALADFRRFPAWMWRNMDVMNFAEWLRAHNRRSEYSVGFYGLDLYSLYTSAREVLRYLNKTDPAAADRARYRYSCFDQFGEDTQSYGYAASYGMTESCEDAVVQQLAEMRRKAREVAAADGHSPIAEMFSAEENAHLVRDAEKYYRAMFDNRVNCWNIRDRHMAETLDRLLSYFGAESKVIVWAHNSHLGDARATEMSRRGEFNLGQLVREKYGPRSFLIGFTTCSGEVTAASNWDEPAERKIIRRALPRSYEDLFHRTSLGDFMLPLRDGDVRESLAKPMLERAIGVIYRPDSERLSHYFEARLAEQFDAVIHLDRTRALIPLEKTVPWERGEVPETYPSAI